MEVDFYRVNAIDDRTITFVVIGSRYHDQWFLVRHQDRTTWEIPGGHRELWEDLEQAARRELFEETGAVEFELYPVCIYSVIDGAKISYGARISSGAKISFGKLFFAEIKSIGQLPDLEITKTCLVDDWPEENLTYPLIQPLLHKKVLEYLASQNIL
jgi:8-oxo-dGTP diphosphatase